jgi:hypothetical protein
LITRLKFTLQIVPALLTLSVAIWTVQMLTPSSEAVRVRNSLIFDTVSERELMWAPAEFPETFKREHDQPPADFQQALQKVFGSTKAASRNFSDALALGNYLAIPGFHGGAIQRDSITALHGIVDHGTGYCADFAQVYSGLAHASSIAVREWGMSFDGFGGNGHSFNEIYDEERQRWVFIDTYFSFYVQDKFTGEPLSVLEFRKKLLSKSERHSIKVVPINDKRFLFASEANALDYYAGGIGELFMIWGNNVFEYDRSTAVAAADTFSRAIEQLAGIVIGVHPEIRIIRTNQNRDSIHKLHAVRSQFLSLMVIGLVAFILLIWQIIGILRSRPTRLRPRKPQPRLASGL